MNIGTVTFNAGGVAAYKTSLPVLNALGALYRGECLNVLRRGEYAEKVRVLAELNRDGEGRFGEVLMWNGAPFARHDGVAFRRAFGVNIPRAARGIVCN